jgi:hypothetical protein
MALFWKLPKQTLLDTVGPDFTLRLNDPSLLEGRHMFTAFQNRLKLAVRGENGDCQILGLDGRDRGSSIPKGSQGKTANHIPSASMNKQSATTRMVGLR